MIAQQLWFNSSSHISKILFHPGVNEPPESDLLFDWLSDSDLYFQPIILYIFNQSNFIYFTLNQS